MMWLMKGNRERKTHSNGDEAKVERAKDRPLSTATLLPFSTAATIILLEAAKKAIGHVRQASRSKKIQNPDVFNHP